MRIKLKDGREIDASEIADDDLDRMIADAFYQKKNKKDDLDTRLLNAINSFKSPITNKENKNAI